MKLIYTLLITLFVFVSCRTQKIPPDNTKPMYGEVEKYGKYNDADNEFIETCVNQFGSIDSAVVVHIDHAWRYFYNNDLVTAMKRFNHTWLLDPSYPDSYFGFASLLEMQGNFAEAKRFEKIGIEKDKNINNAENCYQRIAECKEQLKDIEGTKNAYVKITAINPKNSFAFKKVAYFQMELNNPNEALIAYEKAIELDPEDATTYNNRAYLYQSQKDYNAAITDYSKAIELNPRYISALVNRGIVYMEINQHTKSHTDFATCVKLDPKAGELRRFLALSEFALDEKLKACENLKFAVKLGDSISEQLIMEKCK